MKMRAKGTGLLMLFGLEPLEKEPAAAQAWLERASLPEQVKARLLNPGNNQ